MVKTYKLKVTPLRALQWTGDNIEEAMDFCPRGGFIDNTFRPYYQGGPTGVAEPGDYIVEMFKDYFTVEKKSFFEAQYEECDDQE